MKKLVQDSVARLLDLLWRPAKGGSSIRKTESKHWIYSVASTALQTIFLFWLTQLGNPNEFLTFVFLALNYLKHEMTIEPMLIPTDN